MTSTARRKTLLLVDGNSLLYRSFFAIPRLTNREGTPTNAVYGFATVLRKLLNEESPGYAAVSFDAGGATFRHALYHQYKANRPETPDDLATQLPYARKLCSALGLPLLEIRGVEADDVIATLARRASSRGYHVLIVSSDKDFLQLVNEGVHVIHPGKEIRYDPAAVKERFGVPPEQVIDILALMGDKIDNVPGVPGIGEKGAVQLIGEWGSLESALENAERVSNKRQREGLKQHAEQAKLSKELVRLETEVPVEVEIENLRYQGARQSEAFQLFEELGFTTLLKDYLPEAPPMVEAEYRRCQAPGGLEELVREARHQKTLALSLSLSQPRPTLARIDAIGLASSVGRGWWIVPAEEQEETEALRLLAPVLSSESILKVGDDLKSARVALGVRGVELAGVTFDTSVASYVLNPSKRSHDLDTLSIEVLRRPLGKTTSERGQGVLPGLGVAVEAEGKLAAEKAEATLPIRQRLESRIRQEDLEAVFRDLEMPLISVLADMERVGILLDAGRLGEMSAEIGAQLDALTAEIYSLAGCEFNINSPKQLGEILFEKMNLPSFRKTQKQRQASTRVDVLEELAVHFELPRKILDYRTLSKLKGTYVDALPALVNPATGRIHTSFNQTVAATGRLSSSDPNLQNIPIRTELGRRIRSAFVAQPGWSLLSADYSQIELRVLAHLSGDPALTEAFERGEDIHRRTAERVFGNDTGLSEAEQRRRAKIINFSIIYGKTAYTLGKEFGVPTRQAQAFIDSYFERYPKVRELLDRIVLEARKTGKVRTLFGRQRYIPEIGSRNRTTREAAQRVAVNTPIQGTAADLIKKAMIDLWRELRRRELRARLLLQVHDELVLEVPQEEEERASKLVRDVMEGVYPLAVPLEVDITVAPSWEH